MSGSSFKSYLGLSSFFGKHPVETPTEALLNHYQSSVETWYPNAITNKAEVQILIDQLEQHCDKAFAFASEIAKKLGENKLPDNIVRLHAEWKIKIDELRTESHLHNPDRMADKLLDTKTTLLNDLTTLQQTLASGNHSPGASTIEKSLIIAMVNELDVAGLPGRHANTRNYADHLNALTRENNERAPFIGHTSFM
jgi:hypothetical protein